MPDAAGLVIAGDHEYARAYAARGDGVGVPAVRPQLLSYAAEIEAERDHVLASSTGETLDDDALAEAQRQRDTPDALDEPAFQALNASAHFDRVLYDGGEFVIHAQLRQTCGDPPATPDHRRPHPGPHRHHPPLGPVPPANPAVKVGLPVTHGSNLIATTRR
jgi:hypothetical protein